jgi:hypothetical protein
VFAVNTSTFAVTTASSKFTVATDNGAAGENVHTFLIDATHVMVI